MATIFGSPHSERPRGRNLWMPIVVSGIIIKEPVALATWVETR